MNFLWNSERNRSLTNSPLGLSLTPAAWFLKIRSSSQRRLTANVPALEDAEDAPPGVCPSAACRLSSGLPVAISASRSAWVAASDSAS